MFYFAVDYGISIAELAAALDPRGFESLFVPEHAHILLSRKTPFPSGGEMPPRYAYLHDLFVALSFAAAAMKKLRLGTGIRLIPERDPIVTAKCVGSLDQLSGGRFEFGMGLGWKVEEMENHGARYNTRFKLMRERILAMKALWAQNEAEYHGKMVDFARVWSWPKPVQRAASANPARRRERLHAAPPRRVLRRLIPAPRPRLRDHGAACTPAPHRR